MEAHMQRMLASKPCFSAQNRLSSSCILNGEGWQSEAGSNQQGSLQQVLRNKQIHMFALLHSYVETTCA